MKAKLFDMPMTKAYVITTGLSAMPAFLLALFLSKYLGSNDSASVVRSQIQSAHEIAGRVPSSEITQTVSHAHVFGWWVLASMVLFIFTGATLRILLGNN